MKRCLLLVLLLLLPAALAVGDDTLYYQHSLTIDGSILNPVDIVATGPRPSISSLTANVSWFPKDGLGQKTLFLTSEPDAKISNGAIFTLKDPLLQEYSFDLHYQVQTSTDAVPVKQEVSFPVTGIDSDIADYLATTDTIDINDDIRSIAASLAADGSDLFKVASVLAAWTKENIEYDLSTVAVEASQPSSWVLEHREGVCDEMTNLFISMCRSLGIPARFVSGLSYTNSELFTERWGAHGWAEVYFPGVGWVPFDVTYGQLGWVDATHIAFSKGLDSDKYASSYEWLGRDVSVVVQGMELDAEVSERQGVLDPLFALKVLPVEKQVAIGSANIIVVEVRNPSSQYAADEVVLSNVEGLSLLDDAGQMVSLGPGERRKLYWRVLVDDDLDDGYIYTFPFTALSHRGASAEGSFSAASSYRMLSSLWAEQYVKQVLSSDGLPYSAQVDFVCAAGDRTPRPGEQVNLSCLLRNNGDVSLSNVQVCTLDECRSVSVLAGEQVQVSFSMVFDEESVFALSFSATHSLVEKFAYVPVEVISRTEVQIRDVQTPGLLDYDESGTIHFVVEHVAGMPAHDVLVSLKAPRFEKEWSFESLETTKVFDISLEGSALSLKDDQFMIIVTYLDERDQARVLEAPFEIGLGDLSLWERIMLWLSMVLE